MKIEKGRKQYRYPGVTPFTTDQSHIFFGRGEESNRLVKLIHKEPLVVLHGKSGLGKSSLINAGIIPQFEKNDAYFPIIIRFGAWSKNNAHTPIDSTKKVLKISGEEEDTFLSELLPEDDSLWLYAKNRQIIHSKKPLLIFDQFEELFSYPDSELNLFKQELSELLHTGIPLRFRRKLENLSDDEISEEQEELLDYDLDSRILFSIRSDRMHLLDRMKDFLPNILRNNFELKALSIEDAKAAIINPAKMEGDFISPKFSFTNDAIDKLLKFLVNEDEQKAEGILIQMLCEHYEKNHVVKEGSLVLGQRQIDEPNKVIINYYDDKISSLDIEKQASVRLLIEEGLVSEGDDGMRMSLHEAFITQEFHIEKQLLDVLVDKRLLRSEPFMRGGYTFELSHDRLVPAVINSRKKRRQKEELEQKEREAQLLREQAELQKQDKLKAQRQLRTVRTLLLLAIVGLVLAFVGFYYARKQTEIAKENELLAQQKEEEAQLKAIEAEKERDLANTLRMRSDSMLLRIQQQQGIILSEKEKTQKALEEAQLKEALRKEEEQKRILEEQKNIKNQIDKIKTLLKVNDKIEAKKLLDAALKIAPDNPELLNLKKSLSN
jgi:hypothetical protein